MSVCFFDSKLVFGQKFKVLICWLVSFGPSACGFVFFFVSFMGWPKRKAHPKAEEHLLLHCSILHISLESAEKNHGNCGQQECDTHKHWGKLCNGYNCWNCYSSPICTGKNTVLRRVLVVVVVVVVVLIDQFKDVYKYFTAHFMYFKLILSDCDQNWNKMSTNCPMSHQFGKFFSVQL